MNYESTNFTKIHKAGELFGNTQIFEKSGDKVDFDRKDALALQYTVSEPRTGLFVLDIAKIEEMLDVSANII